MREEKSNRMTPLEMAVSMCVRVCVCGYACWVEAAAAHSSCLLLVACLLWLDLRVLFNLIRTVIVRLSEHRNVELSSVVAFPRIPPAGSYGRMRRWASGRPSC